MTGNNLLRLNDKVIVLNGVDPISYFDFTDGAQFEYVPLMGQAFDPKTNKPISASISVTKEELAEFYNHHTGSGWNLLNLKKLL